MQTTSHNHKATAEEKERERGRETHAKSHKHTSLDSSFIQEKDPIFHRYPVNLLSAKSLVSYFMNPKKKQSEFIGQWDERGGEIREPTQYGGEGRLLQSRIGS